ncbi:phosphonoacetaldehyde reductase [Sphingomonas soli]|uniref:phosphonoacetaldehyde reductase n=1 Tax=Sphingomonas soli TaxID=266127 RepID=UPI00082C6B94|nr:phosphonoacetaldehyde reductase [Sphingomonas soli]
MAVSWKYANPVEVTFGASAVSAIRDKVAGRSYCLLTYNDHPYFDEMVAAISSEAGVPAVVVRDVEPNPSFDGLRIACRSYGTAASPPEVIVAFGGGSVIDTAKVLAAAGGDFARVQAFLEGRADAETLSATPIIAVPTTFGTGSEVTSWATVWDTEIKKKYSLNHESLYPQHAIIDPMTSLGVPRALTLATGLDTLSHALESIWNVNANPVSTNHAVFAAREILDALPKLVEQLDDVDLRTRVARASLFAGLAFSNTKTSLAHSLSYYLTLHHGTVHGIACSFTLSAVMRSVIGQNEACDAALARIFGGDLSKGVEQLEAFLTGLGISTRATDYGVTHENWIAAIDDALDGERGRNFISTRAAVLAAVA